MMNTAYDFAEALIPLLKQRGYRKRNLTWVKTKEEITLIFYIQKSQFSKDVWFYLFAVGLNILSEKPICSFEKSHMFFRLDQTFYGHLLTAEDIVEMVDWNEISFDTEEKIRKCAEEGMLPGITLCGGIMPELREYLAANGSNRRGTYFSGMNYAGPMEKYKKVTEEEMNSTLIQFDSRQLEKFIEKRKGTNND